MPPDVFLPQPQDGGGGFWGGLLDVLRNVPITIGGPKSRIQLPSYNEMTAGRRLVDYGRAQGLDIPPTGSVSPGEGQFMIQEGLRRRQSAPLGMDVAQQFMPPQAGEGPEVMARRAMLAQLPRSALPGLMSQLIATEGGMPGLSAQALDPSALLGAYPDARQQPLTQAPYIPPSGAAGSPGGTVAAPPAAAPAAPPAAPSTAPLAQPPPLPTEPSMQINRQDVETHPAVRVAMDALRQRPYDRTLQQNARKAIQEAEAAIFKHRRDRYALERQSYGDELKRWELQTAPERAGAAATATQTASLEAQRQHKLGLPLYVTEKEDGSHWLHTQKGEPLPQTMLTGHAETLAQQGQARKVSDQDYIAYQHLQEAVPIVREGVRLTEQVYDILEDSYLGKMTPAERANPLQWLEGHLAQVMQDHPELIQAQRFWDASIQTLARGIGSARGDLSTQELARSVALVPQLGYLLRAIGVKGAFGGGFSVQLPSQQVPDTREVALRTMDNTMRLVNSRAQRILGNPQFQFEGLRPRGEAQYGREREEQRVQGGEVSARPLGPAAKLATAIAPPVGKALTALGNKAEKALGLSPGTPAPGRAQPQTAPGMQQVKATALKQLGLTQPPSPTADAQGFQAFMGVIYQQVGRYRPDLSPAQRAELTQLIAQRLGGTWQPPR